MPNWSAPPRPAEYVEQVLIDAILDGTYPPNSTLPGERDLAEQLGVTRPTLREALQRMARDGWITIQQGKSTEVRDVWTEGGLNILGSLVHYGHKVPFDFVPKLLEVRLILAPAYARAAVANEERSDVITYLNTYVDLETEPRAYARFDWCLHHILTVASGNPIYTLILNGFEELYETMGYIYFALPEAMDSSQDFYADLLAAAQQSDPDTAEVTTRAVMAKSQVLWKEAERQRQLETKQT